MERTTSRAPDVDEETPGQPASERVAELERQVSLWKLRAESAEAAISVWRETQGRSLWRFLLAVDRIRARVAPPQTRRDRIARAAAYRLSNGLLRIGREVPHRPSERVVPTGRKAVLFVFDDLGGICTRYRCDHQAEQLTFLGTSYDVAHSAEVDLAAAVDHYEIFLLSRVAWSDEVAAFFEQARARNKTVLFDTDDLIFEPELHGHFAFLDRATEEQRDRWMDELDAYRKTLVACDGVIVTTETLRRFALRRNDRVEIVFNALSEELLRLAEDAIASEGAPADYGGSDVTIAYLSGTPTHDRDFLEAADALLWALDAYPYVRLLVVGKLELDSRFERFAPRITRIRKQPWQAVPEILTKVDINLAPLERENHFTESKSCLKYLEAGLLGVPTVASRRDDFVRAIDHGRNGLLADNPHEWREALRLLIESKDLRLRVGRIAYDDVRRHHTTKARAPLLEQALSRLAEGRTEESLTVNVLASPGGLDGTIEELARHLSAVGHDVAVYEPNDLHRPADVSVATDPRSAQAVAAHDSSLLKCYLISTLETDWTSYELPLRHIALGQDLAERLAALTGRPTEHVEPSAVGEQLEELLRRIATVRIAESGAA